MSTGRVEGLFIGAVLILICSLLWGTVPNAAEKLSLERPDSREKIRIASFPGTVTALLYVAEEKGFYQRHGAGVSLQLYDAGVTSLEDLARGNIDIATVMEFPYAIGRVKMDDSKIIASVAASKNLELVMRRDRGVSRPSDCRGKKIGVMRGTFGEFFLGVFLSFNGIRAADVEKVDLRPADMEEAVIRGSVDGVIVWPPFVLEIKKKLGEQVVSWPAQGAQDSYALLVTKERMLRSRSLAIDAVLRALVDAQDYTEKQPGEAQEIMKRRFGYETPLLLSMWRQDRLQVELKQDLLTLMEDEARWAMQNKVSQARGVPNFLNHVSLEPLKKIRPEAVTIIH